MPPPPKPPGVRRNRTKPETGEWRPSPGVGWQHGPIPEPPDGLIAASREAWTTWMSAWFASNWTPADLPGLRVCIEWYDVVVRRDSKANDVTALMRLMDTYGITPAGQQSRRWQPPKAEDGEQPATGSAETKPTRYEHLRVAG